MTSTDHSHAAKRQRRIVASTSIGSPPEREVLLDVQTIQAKIYNFADLPQQRGEFILTSKLTAHDLTWEIQLYPRGDNTSNETTEYVSVYLHCNIDGTGKRVKAQYTIELGLPGSSMSYSNVNALFCLFSAEQPGRGWKDFAKRRDVLSKCLDDEGALEINIDIQIFGKSMVWYPKTGEKASYPLGRRLLESGMESDVTFIVGDEQETFQAHKIIIGMQAPVLYELVQNSQAGTGVAIPKISGPIFKAILEHIYTGVLPEIGAGNHDDDYDDAKLLLSGADTFGLTTLKLQIESELVSKILTTANAADLLLFADGHFCPLLKEACLDKCTNNMPEVRASTDWPKVLESSDLISEIVLLLSSGSKRVLKDSKDYDNMSVRKLREELESFGLDLDGTKEMLIQRLRDNDPAAELSSLGESN